ncbi:MAG: 30S ribosomal protein S1, partial [Pseudomonadota bacterium]
EVEEEKKAMSEFGSSDSGASLGDILGAALQKREQEVQAAKAEPKKATAKKASAKKTAAKKAAAAKPEDKPVADEDSSVDTADE